MKSDDTKYCSIIIIYMTYLRKFTQPQFDQILKQVLPRCTVCNNTKYHICIEQICNPTRLICHQCQEQYVCSQHFVHEFIDFKYLSKDKNISQIEQAVLKYYDQLLIELQNDKEICAQRLQISQNQTNKLSQSLEYINASLDMLFQRRLFHSSRLAKKQQLYDELKMKIEKHLQEFNITENLDQIKRLVNLLKSTQFSILNQKEMLSQICDREYELDIFQSLQTKINNYQQYIKGLKYLHSAIKQEKTFSLEKHVNSRNQDEIEEGCVELKLSFGYVDKYNFYALPHTLKKLSIESYKIMNDNGQFLLSTNIQQLHLDGLYHENSHTKSFIGNCLKKKLKALTFYKNGIGFGFDHYQELQNKKYQLRRMHQTSLCKANKLIRQQLIQMFQRSKSDGSK